MSLAIESCISSDGVLLAEAGTGTGKTLAYLVPVILSGAKAVISTGTKTLQEQIFFKDLPFVSGALGLSINAVCLKGQENYLCLRRFQEFLASPSVLAFPPEQVAEVTDWARTTRTGDRMEITGLKDDDPMWREICSTRETRLGAKCPNVDACFVTRVRQQAQRATLVIVNHHLYFADLATRQKGGSILPDHDILIFDEAHTIEDIATEFFSTAVSSARVDRALNDVRSSVRNAKLSDDPAVDRCPKLIVSAKQLAREVFSLFSRAEGRVRFVPEEIGGAPIAAYHRLDAALDATVQSLKVIEGRSPDVDRVMARLEGLRNDFDHVIAQSKKGFVHWVENRKRSVVLGASPIDIREILRQGVFFATQSVVLTSATLSVGGNFEYLKNRLGIDFDAKELSVPSPFDYEAQARVYLADRLPDPRDPAFTDAAAAESLRLIELTNGGTLFLFTAINSMRKMHQLLKSKVPGPLLLQGEAPRSTLLKQFIEDPGSVLCATASFWQGVDIPGDALRLVIIDKLPFASPKDPLTQARIVDLQEKGGKPFIEYQVPQAALSLKQGAGRLIRTRLDMGIVAILDSRLKTKSYASVFLKSLPTCPILNDVEALAYWWRSTKNPAAV